MPSSSEKQRRFMGMVHAYKQGKLKDAPPEVKKVAKTISDTDAADFAANVKESFMQFLERNTQGDVT